MVQQIVTISADGSVSTLQRKKGKGVDIRPLGNIKIERATLIEWSTVDQRWFINVLRPTVLAWMKLGGLLDIGHWQRAGLNDNGPGGSVVGQDGVLLFEDYDDAVAAEVAFLEALRASGTY